jgi:ubiquinone/menaquinone biosynthesis C-methylase UbiE
MLKRARRRAASLGKPLDLVLASAEALPFLAASFDSVIATLVFCTIPDPAAAAGEVRRVLASGGRIHFLEDVRARQHWLARCQEVATPLWTRLLAGCHPNRETLPILEKAGLQIERCERRGALLVCGWAR